MAWNRPGGDKDPWGGRGEQGPPDLDEIVRNVQRRFGGLFGGRGGGGSGGGDAVGRFGLGIFLLLAFLLWMISGFYIVREGQAGVVLQFGRYVRTADPGLRWRWPAPIESNMIVDVKNVNTVEVGYRTSERARQRNPVPKEALMLTEDENIIDIQFAVQYRIGDPVDFLFHVSTPIESADSVVLSATESAVREVVGRNPLDFVFTVGRAEIVQSTKTLLQAILDKYQTGIQIVTVEMQDAQPPAEVKEAFDDAVKAREDQVRLKNEAEAYARDVVPRARGRAAALIQEGEAYKAEVIARADGQTQRFTNILKEYEKAPAITRQRMYLETMEQVLSGTTKILVDQKGGNNILYLPLDRIVGDRGARVLPDLNESSQASEPARARENVSPRTRASQRVPRP